MADDYSDFDDSIPSTPSFYSDGPFVSSSPGDLEQPELDWGSDSPGNISSQSLDTADASDSHQSLSSSSSSSPVLASSPSSPSSAASLSEYPQNAPPPAQQQNVGQRIVFSLAAVAHDRQPSQPAPRHPRFSAVHGHDDGHGHSHNHSHDHSRRDHIQRAIESSDEHLRRLRRERDSLLREYREARAARRDRRRDNNNHQAQPANNNSDIVLIDELFDMEVDDPRTARSSRPAAAAASASASSSAAPPPRAQPQPQPQQPQQPQTVIDLTDEPDSPVQQQRPFVMPRAPLFPQSQGHRNPRRQMSQNRRTPSFARSDGSILGANPDVIDLTIDSPDDLEQERNQSPDFINPDAARRRDRDRRNILNRDRTANPEISLFAQLHNFRRSFPVAFDLPQIMAGLGRHLGAQVDLDVQIIGQNNVAPPPNPLANNPVDFNYQANGFGGFGGRAPTPKPAFEAPPPPREGFTRESGPDVVVICPCCDDELKYNAEDKEDGPPAKKARTRKDREEHHFWAVKACGHVFCKRCFDDRKNNFPLDKTSTARQPKVLCAVEDCESDVSQKTAWVGIFM